MTSEIARRYDISTIVDSLYRGSEDNINVKQCVFKGVNYRILRYNKDNLNKTDYNTIGLFRSVIYKDDRLVSYAPPKSIDYTMFKDQVPLSQIISMEEHIDGTMVNVFWDGDSWEIATRSSVGGEVSFFSDDSIDGNHSFRWMFLDAIATNESNAPSSEKDFFSSFDNMPKFYCLSFVLQHPKNRIVVPFDKPSLYLVKTFDLSEKGVVTDVPIFDVSEMLPGWVKQPPRIYSTLEELEKNMTSGVLDHTTVGAMIYGVDSITGNIVRTKIRNSTYEIVRQLRGNQPKLKYRYLMLRNEGKVTDYLTYYPEHKEQFSIYREQIHEFTYNLYSSYVSCYIKKFAPLKNYPDKYRTHMFKLHELYKFQLVQMKKFVTKNVVVDYVNKLHPSLLMYSINISNQLF